MHANKHACIRTYLHTTYILSNNSTAKASKSLDMFKAASTVGAVLPGA